MSAQRALSSSERAPLHPELASEEWQKKGKVREKGPFYEWLVPPPPSPPSFFHFWGPGVNLPPFPPPVSPAMTKSRNGKKSTVKSKDGKKSMVKKSNRIKSQNTKSRNGKKSTVKK